MSLMTRVGLLAGASALVLSGASFADNPTEAQNLQARIADLEATVARLNGEQWLNDQRAEEIRSLVQDVLADADTRASLLQAGMTAGYDNGFVIGSADGNFNLKLNGQLQFRFVWNNQDNETASDTNRWGFENTRTKLMFSGNVVDPTWRYYIEGNFYRSGGAFTLEDAWIGKDFGNGWTMFAGQMKVPVIREWLVHSKDQLAVERSNVAYGSPAASRTQGIALDYKADQFHFVGSYNDGANAANGVWSGYDTEWAFSARGEFLFSGNWDQFNDFTSPRGSEQGIMAGVGAHYQNAEYGTLAANELEVMVLTGDVSFEFDGANIFGAIVYTNTDNNAGTDTDVYGVVIQGGYYFNDEWEGFLRWEWNDFDMTGVDELNLITIGVNGYYSPNVKMTTDIGYGLDSVYSASDITGWQSDSGDEDGQFVFRTQLQLVF